MGKTGSGELTEADASAAMISVAICTYNRSASLARTLDSLTQLRVPEGLDWELWLIDNNSSDETVSIARAYESRLPLRYLFERKQGLSHARNRALEECHGDAIAFADDDILVDREWLSTYAEGFRRYSDAVYCGGPIHPYWPDGRPNWIRDEGMPLISGLLGYYDLGGERRPYTADDMHPFGANFALSRKLFERMGLFRTDLGVSGTTPGRGEEAEYFKRARSAGVEGKYLPEALCLHAVQKSHLTLSYLYRYGVQKGVAAKAMNGDAGRQRSPLFSQAMLAMRGLYQLAKGRGDRARQCVINIGIQQGLAG